MSDKNTAENPTMRLLRVIGPPFSPAGETSAGEAESLELYHLAAGNKVSLLYLEALEQQGKLSQLQARYQEERGKYSRFLGAAARVSQALSGVEHALFKTVRPYPAVPTDIDVIVLGNHDAYREAIQALLRQGYTPLLPGLIDRAVLAHPEALARAADRLTRPTYGRNHISPGGTNFTDPETGFHVDLQREVSVSYLVYMDKVKFKGYLWRRRLAGGEVNTLAPELELTIAVAHSLAEQRYRLGEFYTFLCYLREMGQQDIQGFIHLIGEHRWRHAAAAFVSLTAELHRAAYGQVPDKLNFVSHQLGFNSSEVAGLLHSGFALPHPYRALTLLLALGEKLGEGRFRASLATQAIRMLDPRLVKLTISELRGRG